MNSLTIEPIYGSSWLAMAAAGVTLAVIFSVTPPTENQSHRRWLIALRSIAATVLLLALIRPALLRSDNQPADAALIVAVDTSRSMTLPDGTGSDRWTAQTDAWRQLAGAIIGIDPNLDVRLIAYDQSTRKLDAQPAALESVKPIGELTDLGTAGLAAIQSADGQPIAGIVMMGDGTQTASQSGPGVVRVAETLDSLGVPFWTVPIGPPGAQSASRDVAINALDESYELFAGNQVDISFQVLMRGLVGVDVPISLSWIDGDGNQTEAATRRVAANNANESIPFTIQLTAPPPGTYRLQVSAAPQDGELITTNNIQTAFVDVREGGGRILYIEGTLRNEQTLMRRSLRRFQDLDLTFRTILKDTAGSWPIDLNDAFQIGKYDIYIIGDLDASALGDKQLAQLADTVAAGAGLVTLGGYQAYGAGGYATSPLADVIPIKMDRANRRSIDAPTSDRPDQIAGPLSIVLSRRHGITDLGGTDPDGTDTAQTWQQLPSLLGANRWSGPKVAPGVEVLLETPEEQPLLVIGQYGRGRTAALAFDSTWRWWRGGSSDAHRRFWRQLMLWLLSREESGQRIMIEMDARRFAISDPPEFRARLQSIESSDAGMVLVAEWIDEAGKVTPIETTTTSNAESIGGRLPPMQPGFGRLRVRLRTDNDAVPPEEKAFQAIDESRELANPQADLAFLKQLANMTAEHGGGAYAPDDIDALIETIKDRRRAAESPIVKKFRLGDGPISGWIMFTLFAGTLTTEWLLRRRWGLA